MWYIWKNRNEKVYNNTNKNPQEILRLAEVEGALWALTQIKDSQFTPHALTQHQVSNPGNLTWWCIDEAWKASNNFTRHGWFCIKEGSAENMMGSMNIWMSLSLLHVECEALIWKIECMARGGCIIIFRWGHTFLFHYV